MEGAARFTRSTPAFNVTGQPAISAPAGFGRDGLRLPCSLTAQGDATRVDHELEMRPKRALLLFAPMMGMIARKNLRGTANALQAHLER